LNKITLVLNELITTLPHELPLATDTGDGDYYKEPTK